jgi:SAM-dependent methyltransferase
MATRERPNADTIEAWNTVLYEKFCRYQHLLIEGLGSHGTKLFESYPPAPGSRVADIGCGLGDTVVQLGALVGESGEVVGIDCAENFIDASRERAVAKQTVSRVSFRCCDVQFEDLGGPYDAAYSRFGTMFFDSPVPALRNIRKSLVPGGKLHMSVWRKRQDNPCFYVAQQAVEQFISEEDKATDQVTCGPGPFSMAGPDMVSDQLLGAGFTDVQFLRFDAPLCIGRDVDEALDFARDIGPAGEAIRLASGKAGHLAGEIEQALREAFAQFDEGERGVWATSSTWLVTAVAPAS